LSTEPAPFRFAVQSLGTTTNRGWLEEARRAEALGYSALHTSDHFLGPGAALDASHHPVQMFAPLPALAAAAGVTSTLRLGCRVLCVDYRVPALLAHELATLDALSEGRLEVGLGAGWFADEYEAAGLRMDAPGERIARLESLVRALKAYFGGEELNIEDGPVTMRGYRGVPAVVQRPHPPILIGGGGPKVLALAARHADIVSINSNQRSGKVHDDSVSSATAQHTDEQIRVVRKAAGDRFGSLEIEMGAYFTLVTNDLRGGLARVSRRTGVEPDELADHPHVLVGSVEHICEQLCERRARYGLSYVTVFAHVMDPFAGVVARLAGR
jgi:probable F420-dependent oxidoreductase